MISLYFLGESETGMHNEFSSVDGSNVSQYTAIETRRGHDVA